MNELKLAILHQSPSQRILRQKADALASGGAENTVTELKHAAQEFASFLYLEVLKAMRATLPKDGLFENDSLSRDIYSSMFDSEVARVLAKRDAEGFAGIVERAIEKIAPISRTRGSGGEPVDSAAPSGFDTLYDPVHRGKAFHSDIEVTPMPGAEVKALSGRKVTWSGRVTADGNMVESGHSDGTTIRYAHNAVNLVSAGEQIEAGPGTALVGSRGRVTGGHIQFELRQAAKPMDPAHLVGATYKGSKVSSAV